MLPAKTLTIGNIQCQQLRGNSRPLPSRGRLKKGKTLAKRKTVHEVMVEEQQLCTKLPNITTTQLVRRLPVGELKLKGNQSENAFVQQKETWVKARKFPRAALKNEIFKVDDEDELNGLIVSRLDNRSKDFSTASDSSINRPFPNFKSKLTGRSSYTGTEDSGFGEENCELSMSDNNFSRNSCHSGNTTSGPTLNGRESFMDIRRLETRNLPNDSLLPGRCPGQLVIRRNEVTNLRVRMCTQSHLSLHSDMMALKSLTIHSKSQRERLASDLKTTKPCEEERVYKLGSMRSPSSSDPSLSILKKKQKPFFSRRSSGIESISLGDLCTNINSRNTFQQKDSNLQEYDANGTKKCVRFNLDNFELSSDCDVENPSYPSISSRGSTSTSESLREAIGNEKAMDVNSKCEEWLNRWLEAISGH